MLHEEYEENQLHVLLGTGPKPDSCDSSPTSWSQPPPSKSISHRISRGEPSMWIQ